MNELKSHQSLPEFFKPLFWSYDFPALDLDKNKKTIVLNTINYGDLKHWRWLKTYYGEEALRSILVSLSATEFKKRTGRLVELLFNFKLNDVSHGAHS